MVNVLDYIIVKSLNSSHYYIPFQINILGERDDPLPHLLRYRLNITITILQG